MTVEIVLLKKPELHRPKLICGLPGSGFVAKLALDHLVKELNAELFCLAYSHSFPPQVYVRPDGAVELIKHELYYWKSPDSSSDLILYSGDAQPVTPEAEYEMASKILDVAISLGADMIYTLAAYITGQFVESPKVYGTVTDRELLEELQRHGVKPMLEGSITGMNGLLVGLAKVKGIKGMTLLGETSGYMIDAKASQAVLQVLTKMLGITVNMQTLEERAKQDEALIKQLEEMKRRAYEKPRPPEKELGYIS